MIRDATDADLDTICDIHTRAFGSDAEADLVRALVADETAKPLLSLVADQSGALTGHVLFTQARIEGDASGKRGLILAPLAVLPENHGQGTGGTLVRAGLARAAEDGYDMAFVYGDPNYYGRFGFTSARPHGLAPSHPVPPEYADAWMVLTPDGDAPGVSGRVLCCAALDKLEYW